MKAKKHLQMNQKTSRIINKSYVLKTTTAVGLSLETKNL